MVTTPVPPMPRWTSSPSICSTWATRSEVSRSWKPVSGKRWKSWRQRTQPAASADALRRGRQLALEGDPGRKLPACTSCHGAALTGVQPATPGLLGLPRDYLLAQLAAWRDIVCRFAGELGGEAGRVPAPMRRISSAVHSAHRRTSPACSGSALTEGIDR